MTQEILLEKLQRYEAALQQIARKIDDQTALEEHQTREGFGWTAIAYSRADTYKRIAHVVGEALGRYCPVA